MTGGTSSQLLQLETVQLLAAVAIQLVGQTQGTVVCAMDIELILACIHDVALLLFLFYCYSLLPSLSFSPSPQWWWWWLGSVLVDLSRTGRI